MVCYLTIFAIRPSSFQPIEKVTKPESEKVNFCIACILQSGIRHGVSNASNVKERRNAGDFARAKKKKKKKNPGQSFIF